MNRTTCSTQAHREPDQESVADAPIQFEVERIAFDFDDVAWRSFQERTLFRARDGRRMCLAEYAALRCATPWAQRLVGNRKWLLELAYDLLMDRFGPPTRDSLPQTGRRQRAVTSLSCWRALSRLIERSLADGVPRNELEREITVAAIVQGFADRHIRFACLEASRKKNPGRSRYRLRMPGGGVNAWLPVTVPARMRGASLHALLEGVEGSEGLDARSIQALIDRRFGLCTHTGLLDLPADVLVSRNHEEPPQALARSELAARDLPTIAANEKAAAIEQQRPAIRALGPEGLRLLVLAIFEELSTESFRERRLAERFGLSPATFSRFAGSRWMRSPRAQVPDLYANLAHLVAADPIFAESAQEAGVWDAVRQVRSSVPNPRLQRPRHD